MRGKLWSTGLALAGAITLGLVAGGYLLLLVRGASPPPLAAVPGPGGIDQAAAVEQAIAKAREDGLQQERPLEVTAKQMTLREYEVLSGAGGSAPGSAEFGMEPDHQVWVVSMLGTVEWAGPGRTESLCRQCDASDTYDNITIVLSAETGRHVETAVAGSGRPLPLDIPGTSLDEGSRQQPPTEPTEPMANP